MTEFAKPQKCRATCIEKRQLTEKVYFVRYQMVEPDHLDFVAGQTFMLTVAPQTFRSMSIASPPQESTVISSIQDVTPGGPGSRWLLTLQVGDVVEFMAPLGRFFLDCESPRKRIMVATGTGIAPFRSMLRNPETWTCGGGTTVLYWGLRFEEDVYMLDELRSLSDARKDFSFFLTLSKPGSSWQGLNGHVTDHVLANEKDVSCCDFYLCGNKMMITEIEAKLKELGVPRERMKFDPFF